MASPHTRRSASEDAKGDYQDGEREPDHHKRLVQYVLESLNMEEDFHFLRFEFLQRLNIVNLEIDLARMKSRFYDGKEASTEELEELDEKLQRYGKLKASQTSCGPELKSTHLDSYCDTQLPVSSRQAQLRQNKCPRPEIPATQILLVGWRPNRPVGFSLLLLRRRTP